MKNPRYFTSKGIPLALSNLWYNNNSSIVEIKDAVEDSTTGAELVTKLNNLKLFHKFTLDRETDTKVRLATVDCFGNTDYFEVTKEPNIKKEEQIEIDLSTFVLVGNSRLEAYGSHMNFEMGFDSPEVRDLMDFHDFCKELDLGYGNSSHIQIARLYETLDGKIWYDNEYVG